MQVHARPVVDRDEDHEHAVASAAAHDRARRLQVHHEFNDGPGIAAVPQIVAAPVISVPNTLCSRPPMELPLPGGPGRCATVTIAMP